MTKLCLAKHVKNYNFTGRLLVNGDLRNNRIIFRFLFDKPEMVQPLLVWLKVIPIELLKKGAGRRNRAQHISAFVVECNIRDFNNPIMKTKLFYPEFLLRKHMVLVIDIESQVSCRV